MISEAQRRGDEPLRRADGEAPLDLMLHLRPHPRQAAHLRLHHEGHRDAVFLDRLEHARRFGLRPATRRRLTRLLAAVGIRVVDYHAASRAVHVRTTVGEAERAFGVELSWYDGPDGEHLRPSGPPVMPPALKRTVLAVHGLDRRRITPRRRLVLDEGLAEADAARASRASGVGAPAWAAAYGVPAGDGAGVRVTILQFGGGFDADQLKKAFQSVLGDDGPTFAVGSVLGASSNTGDVDGSQEVMLDLQVLGAIVPKASFKVLFAPNDAFGWPEAIRQAVHDDDTPHVISISWGAVEAVWPESARTSIAQSLRDATSLGVTVCCSSGDLGSEPSPAGAPQVEFPASAPDVLACGGTHATLSGGAITAETVWCDATRGTGGGVSGLFPVPTWQVAAAPGPSLATGKAGRGVPDVSANAAPNPGWRVLLNNGAWTAIGGTSAVAPMWAGVIARACAGGRVGLAQPRLYAATGAFRDVTEGGNALGSSRGYTAREGWDPCTGLGAPIGDKVLAALQRKT